MWMARSPTFHGAAFNPALVDFGQTRELNEGFFIA
jgi:hypothetical protein